MGDPMDLTISQRFELERMRRTIDETSDVAELQKLAKMLLQAWQSQKAATGWMMRRGLAKPEGCYRLDDAPGPGHAMGERARARS